MTGRCLGDRVADLADGRMTPAEAERAYAHVAACPACRAALDAQRSASSAVRDLGAPGPSDDLLARLARVAGPAPDETALVGLIPAQQAAPSGAAGLCPSGPAGARPTTSPRRRVRRIAVASAAGAVGLALVAAVGASTAGTGVVTPPAPSIAPVIDTFAVEHTVSVDRMPLSGPQYQVAGFAPRSASASPAPAP